jgi:hypothetical protein
MEPLIPNLGILNESTILNFSSKQPMYTKLIIIVLEQKSQVFLIKI